MSGNFLVNKSRIKLTRKNICVKIPKNPFPIKTVKNTKNTTKSVWGDLHSAGGVDSSKVHFWVQNKSYFRCRNTMSPRAAYQKRDEKDVKKGIGATLTRRNRVLREKRDGFC